jgi:hypothetical protein
VLDDAIGELVDARQQLVVPLGVDSESTRTLRKKPREWTSRTSFAIWEAL